MEEPVRIWILGDEAPDPAPRGWLTMHADDALRWVLANRREKPQVRLDGDGFGVLVVQLGVEAWWRAVG